MFYVGVGLIIFGLLHTFLSRTMWNLRFLEYKDTPEPSTISMIVFKVVGVICIIAGILFCMGINLIEIFQSDPTTGFNSW